MTNGNSSDRIYELALIFSGHMIDSPSREGQSRFPSSLEQAVTTKIAERIEIHIAKTKGKLIGLSSAARGGDLIFLEQCKHLHIDTRIVLPFDPQTFLKTSVIGETPEDQAGLRSWEARYWSAWKGHKDRCKILTVAEDTNPYEACNLKLLELGCELASRVQLLALWNGQGGDGPGGTATFASHVKAEGGDWDWIDITQLSESNS